MSNLLVTAKYRNFVFAVKCILNMHIALVIYIIRERKSERVWIVGGTRGEVYSDNSKAFYEYLLDQHAGLEVAWIAAYDSPASRVARGRIIIKGSIENYLYFYRSRVIVFSDTLNNDVAPLVFALPLSNWFYRRVLKVRLNHGAISFKRRVRKYGFSKIIRDWVMKSYDLNVASTHLEMEVLSTYTKEGSVQLLGSARNDNVHRIPENNVILIAPTWRPWLFRQNDFKVSEFYDNYQRLLTDERLLKLLQSNGLKVQLYFHHMMLEHRAQFESLTSSSVSLFDPEEPLGVALITSKLLITDYSSICAERFFLRKPVAFFQFDRDRYINEVGSYIDLINQPVGPTFITTSSLIDWIQGQVKGGFSISDEQIYAEKYFVHFKDQSNCVRIFNAIISRLTSSRLIR